MLGIIGFPAEDLRKKIEPICTKTCLFEPFDQSCAQQEWEDELKNRFVVFALLRDPQIGPRAKFVKSNLYCCCGSNQFDALLFGAKREKNYSCDCKNRARHSAWFIDTIIKKRFSSCKIM